MAEKTVACIGRLLVDVVVTGVNAHPRRYTPVEVSEITLSPGGSAYFTGKALAAFGINAQLVTATGGDRTGDFLRSLLRGSSLDMKEVSMRDYSRTSASVVTVNRYGDANYYLFRGADHEIGEKIKAVETKRFDAIHIGNIGQLFNGPSSKNLASLLHANGNKGREKSFVSVDFDKVLERNKSIWDNCRHIDVIFGNQQEVCASLDLPLNVDFQELLSTAQRKDFGGNLVVKLGEHGCYLFNCKNSKLTHIKGYRFGATRNENGAGDIFCGVYLASFLIDGDHLNAANLANCVSAKHVAGEIDIHANDFRANDNSGLLKICTNADSLRSPALFEISSESNSVSRSERWILHEGTLHEYLDIIGQSLRLDSSSTVLDVGCGYGRFADPIAQRFGCKVVGLDHDEDAVAYCNNRKGLLSARQCNFISDSLSQSLGAHGERFDFIWASSLAPELVKNKFGDLINQLVGYLRPDGVICVRDETIECAKLATWYSHFSDSHALVERLYPSLSTLVGMISSQSDLCVSGIELVKEVDRLSISDLESRILAKGHAVWRRAYDGNDYLLRSHLDNLIASCADNGFVEFVRFRYVIMAKRYLSKGN
jgi:sugar/nucleoside kinase (ribokinase family)/SAM-dependent methyltransferase